jgi:hypothetical protein
MKTRIILSLSLVAALAACGDEDNNEPEADTGVEDTGADTPIEDIGADVPVEDTGMEDTGTEDTGTEDTGTEDTGTEDTGTEDTGTEDTGTDPTPRGPEGEPSLGLQIDRAGRAAISSALVGTFNGDSTAQGEIKDGYNAASSDWDGFAAEIAGNLAILDSLDTVCGNQLIADGGDIRYSALAGILADDQLYVHSARGTCGVYLGLEAEIVGALPEGDGGCGGRMLDDDVIDRSYSVLAAGILTGVDDLITANDVENLADFPYLAAPHGE